MTTYRYKEVECSFCHKVTECVEVWSNVTPWACRSCAVDEQVYWDEDEEYDGEYD